MELKIAFSAASGLRRVKHWLGLKGHFFEATFVFCSGLRDHT